jgi:transcriptional regulator with XRE-family HTH domain
LTARVGVESPLPDLARTGPHLQRIMLGARLRQLREDSRIDRKAAASAIRGSESKISRIETGRNGCKVRDVEDLLTLYRVTAGPERQVVLDMALQAGRPPWWAPYRDVVPDWFEHYLSLEQDACGIRSYEPCHIPGLLQTADYARAVIEHGNPGANAREIGQRVNLRLRRQHMLWDRRPSPAKLWAVIDEAALRRPAGTAATMRGQLRHLIEVASQPDIRVCVLPFNVGQAGAVGFPFSILRFPGELIPDVVYIECLTHAAYLEKQAEIRYYWHLMNGLATEASSPGETVSLLAQILSGS